MNVNTDSSLQVQVAGASHANSASAVVGDQSSHTYWRFSGITWLVLAACLLMIAWAYYGGLINLFHRWEVEEEYNHGYFLPFVTLVFLWHLAPAIAKRQFEPTWGAVAVLTFALILFVIGELSAIYLLIHYSFILVLFALSLALVGWSGTRLTFAPIGILVFAIPIPYFIEATLTSKLQLISSLIRLCNIPVFREGNLIDLGQFKLEVIEACSGLTYLYPLLGFGAICAYLYHTETWKKVVLIVSTIPIAILLNSFRIGMIGFLVKYFGSEQAEGFLHDFEGFAVFMVCVGILFLEMWALTFAGDNRKPFNEVFGLNFEELSIAPHDQVKVRPFSKPLLASTGLILLAAIFISTREGHSEIKPARKLFSAFPMTIGSWQGHSSLLEAGVLKTLDLTDYLLSDFSTANQAPVNFYVAYYESQRKGSSPHSPTVCLPGGGWQIINMDRRTFDGAGAKQPFEYNRVVIRKGNMSQLVYYWFEERGRVLADEYQVKWYLFRDALFDNRTDGALVRVITPIASGEAEESADQRIVGLLNAALPLLPDYVPQ